MFNVPLIQSEHNQSNYIKLPKSPFLFIVSCFMYIAYCLLHCEMSQYLKFLCLLFHKLLCLHSCHSYSPLLLPLHTQLLVSVTQAPIYTPVVLKSVEWQVRSGWHWGANNTTYYLHLIQSRKYDGCWTPNSPYLAITGETWDHFLETWLTSNPDSKVHGTNMGPTWGRQDPSGSCRPIILTNASYYIHIKLWNHLACKARNKA